MARILIIDDSEIVRTQLRKDLERASHEVVEASDAFQGMESILQRSKELDLIILDYRMPKLNGLDMLAQVKEKMSILPSPVFVVTVENPPDKSLNPYLKDIGVRAWFTKPYPPKRLLEAIASTLGAA